MDKECIASDSVITDDGHEFEDDSSEIIKASKKEKLTCCRNRLQGMGFVLTSVIVVSLAITIALIISIIVGTSQIQNHGAIASESQYCSSVGLNILRKWSNAVDGAVATAMCLTVVRPDFASIGGCGLALVHNRNTQISSLYDFICSAPSNPPSSVSVKNPFSLVGIPGLVKGLYALHSRFGNASWAEVMKGAVQATAGFVPDKSLIYAAHAARQNVNQKQSDNILDRLLMTASTPTALYYPSDEIVKLMRGLQKNGSPVFYQQTAETGPKHQHESIAHRLTQFMQQNNMNWSESDLSDYRVVRPKPLQTGFAGFSFDTFPPPAVGGPYLVDLLASLDLKDSIQPFSHHALQENNATENAALLHSLLELATISESKSAGLGDLNDASIHDAILSAQKSMFSPESRRKAITGIKGNSVLPVDVSAPHFISTDIGNGAVVATDSTGLTVVINLFMGSPFGSLIELPGNGVLLNSALGLFTNENMNKLSPNRRPLVPIAPIYMATTHQRCGVQLGITASGSGGTWGVLDVAQTIVSASLFLRSAKCEAATSSSPTAAPLTSKKQIENPEPGNLRYTPAASHGCISIQKATDLPRFNLGSPRVKANHTFRLVTVEADFPQSLATQLAKRGHEVVRQGKKDYAWNGMVATAGWVGYGMVTSVDKRGSPPSWSMETF